MTENLRTAMHDLADQAQPVTVPDDLWHDARSARRRDLLVMPVLALLLVVGVGVGIWLARPDEAYDPAPADGGRDALPAELHAAPAWMNSESEFPGETDLAVGRVSVAFATSSGRPVVVTADDGAHHLVELPGFESRALGLLGDANSLAVSPDGRRLAWWWHGDLPAPDDEQVPVPSGIRIADLVTGKVETYSMVEGQGVQVGNFAWSPNGRFLVYSKVVTYRFNESSRAGRDHSVELLNLRTDERVQLSRFLARSSELTMSVSSQGAVVQALGEGWLTAYVPTRQPRTEEFVVTPPGDRANSMASALWLEGGESVLIAPTAFENGVTHSLNRVEVADFERGDSILPSTSLRVLDQPALLLGQVAHEWVLALDGPGWDGRLVLFPIAGDLDREPIEVSELVGNDAEDGREINFLSVAWQLVDPEQPNRDYPAPEWPEDPHGWEPVLILASILLLLAVAVVFWWRRPWLR